VGLNFDGYQFASTQVLLIVSAFLRNAHVIGTSDQIGIEVIGGIKRDRRRNSTEYQ
jgi:hypothetical protein